MTARRARWRRASAREVEDVVVRLAAWPAPDGGAVRHLFPLAAIERVGAAGVRLVGDPTAARADGSAPFAAVVLVEAGIVAPCGDPALLVRAGDPVRGWRLVVGDRLAVDALRAAGGSDEDGTVVLAQRYLAVEPDRVPAAAAVPDPGLRPATTADLEALARLAVRLHVDDGFGPDPGPLGVVGYRRRLAETVELGRVWCVGPEGAPVGKVERAVASARWGSQLAGIVVAPEERGRGLGTAMVAEAVRRSLRSPGGPVTLHVREDNAPALAAYASAGFGDLEAWRLAVRP